MISQINWAKRQTKFLHINVFIWLTPFNYIILGIILPIVCKKKKEGCSDIIVYSTTKLKIKWNSFSTSSLSQTLHILSSTGLFCHLLTS